MIRADWDAGSFARALDARLRGLAKRRRGDAPAARAWRDARLLWPELFGDER